MILLAYLFFWKQSSEPLYLLLSLIFIFVFKLLEISLTSVNFLKEREKLTEVSF